MKKLIDKKLFLILCAFYVVYSILYTFKNGVLKYYKIDFKEISWIRFVFDNLFIESIFNISLILFIIVLTKKLIDHNYKWYFIFGLHFILSLLTVILIYFIYDVYLYLFNNLTFDRSFKYYLLNIISYSNTHFLIYFVNVFIIYIYYYVKRISEIELQKSELKQQLATSQVNILKYQLHPHFFFNTLNSISSLIETDAKLAQNLLADFSDLLRDIVNLKDTNVVSLKEEMDILNKYIGIMRIRFSDHLEVAINIEKNLENVLIPSLIFQPILENSFKYGYSYNHTELKISLNIFKEMNNLVIEIENDGQLLKSNDIKYGTGLKNTEDRLKTLFNENYKFSIENKKDLSGVKTIVQFPIQTEG